MAIKSDFSVTSEIGRNELSRIALTTFGSGSTEPGTVWSIAISFAIVLRFADNKAFK